MSCILRSFRSSGKRHLILTGGGGSGRSTLLQELARELDPAALTGLDAAALGQAARAPGEWASVEKAACQGTASPACRDAIRELLDRKQVLAAAGRKDAPFLEEFCSRPDAFCINLDAPFGQQGCVIMASGLGRRFGGNKLLADLAGKPLIQYILEATEGVFARRVVVTRHPEVAELCRARGIGVVLHSQPYRSDTVRLGMEALDAATLQGVMFCPADQPLLGQDTVKALALWGACVPGRICRTAWQGKPGAPVLFPAWTFEELLHLPQGKGGGAVVRQHPNQVDLLEACSAAELADVDRPEDLEALRCLMKG